MAHRIGLATSCACAAESCRGDARKTTPNARKKTATARADVNANALSTPRAARSPVRSIACAMSPISVWNTSHSLTNPLRGGIPARASAPRKKQAAVQGIRLISPPMASRLVVCVAYCTAPAPMKRRLFPIICVTIWISNARKASDSRAGSRNVRKRNAHPRLTHMMPMFSILLYARRRLRSGSTRAERAPSTADTAPAATISIPHQSGGALPPNKNSPTIRSRPYMAVLSMTPDMSAET
jgi:hypothetical protein